MPDTTEGTEFLEFPVAKIIEGRLNEARAALSAGCSNALKSIASTASDMKYDR